MGNLIEPSIEVLPLGRRHGLWGTAQSKEGIGNGTIIGKMEGFEYLHAEMMNNTLISKETSTHHEHLDVGDDSVCESDC